MEQVETKVDALAVQAEKLAAAVVAGMIMEAAYRGETVGAAEIANSFVNDPYGETACYFRRSAYDVVDLLRKLQSDPDLLAVFSGENALARVGGGK